MRGGQLRVLFVCTGNICRSPTAEGIFRKLVADAGMSASVVADSAGTHDYHVGEPPDPRSREAAAERGYDLSALRARRVERADFERFDLIIAMDRGHLGALSRMVHPATSGKLKLMMSYAKSYSQSDVPDPYYGGPEDFERVLDMLEDAARGLLESLRSP
jgi:protein-tyrosine phosphatase